MNILLLADGTFGLRVARILGRRRIPVALLVVDSQRSPSLISEIESAVGVEEERVVDWRDGQQAIAEAVGDTDIDIGISAWWPHILKQSLLSAPRLGILNFHPSLLPHGRGKDPNFWALLNDSPFGVTIHFMDEGVDTGDIAFQSRIEVSWEDDGETLYRRAADELVDLFERNLSRILEGDIPRTPQPVEAAPSHRRAELEPASRIYLDRIYTGRQLLNLLRARTFPPHPGAWFLDNEKRYEVRVSVTEVQKEDGSDEPR